MGLATRSRSPMVEREEQVSSSEEETALLGQTDIRSFFKSQGRADAYKADEEAAMAMGLSLGMRADAEGEEEPHELEEVILEQEDPHQADEDAAISMGIALGLSGDAGAVMDDMEELEEELDMALEVDFEEEAEEVDAAAEAEARRNFLARWLVEDPLKVDEEAAISMGYSLGTDAADMHEDMEEPEPLEMSAFLEADLHEADEEAAIAMGLSLGMMGEVDEQLELLDLLEVYHASPATPPKKMLLARKTEEVTPLQGAKRRRVHEQTMVRDKLGQISMPVVDDVDVGHAH